MSYPVLYHKEEQTFYHNGIGILSDCISCFVTEKINGAFELEMKYPIDGLHFNEISHNSIIKAWLEPGRNAQIFRVWSISKPMSGIVTVKANHISYDLSGIPVRPFAASNLTEALKALKENVPSALTDETYSRNWIGKFNFSTDREDNGTLKKFELKTPSSIRSCIGGIDGNLIERYGGEVEFDNFDIIFHKNRGKDNGASIRYGKNLTSLVQDINCSTFATAVYPFWAKEEDGVMTVVDMGNSVSTWDSVVNGEYKNIWDLRTIVLDLTAEFEEPPSVEELSAAADAYVFYNGLDQIPVSMSVTYAQLESEGAEKVSLCDTVRVEFPAFSVSSSAKVVEVVFDVLKERVESAKLGTIQTTIADTIAQQQQEINKLKRKY